MIYNTAIRRWKTPAAWPWVRAVVLSSAHLLGLLGVLLLHLLVIPIRWPFCWGLSPTRRGSLPADGVGTDIQAVIMKGLLGLVTFVRSRIIEAGDGLTFQLRCTGRKGLWYVRLEAAHSPCASVKALNRHLEHENPNVPVKGG